jgi:hypothetical protein
MFRLPAVLVLAAIVVSTGGPSLATSKASPLSLRAQSQSGGGLILVRDASPSRCRVGEKLVTVCKVVPQPPRQPKKVCNQVCVSSRASATTLSSPV